MGDGEDWLMRPVLEGLCTYQSLIDGSLDIGDVYRMNESLDVRNENTWRAQKAAEANAR